ncbi:MAG: hypothetical protein U1D99_08925 [Candidatus Omnitrophota bacterium]|nr:hypothetical protein [Candidatus Omnitrophota bacterium]
MGFLFINGLIFFTHILLAHRLGIPGFSGRLLYAGVLSMAQIISWEIILGIFGVLYRAPLIGMHLLTCAGIFLLGIPGKKRIPGWLALDARVIRSVGRDALFSFENACLLGLVAFVSAWLFVSAYFLPPRGTDDLSYHLPVIFETILHHKIQLLPVDLNGHFAFPMNAEMLFLWPVIYFHHIRWVDIVQWVVGFFGVLAIYRLAGIFSVPRRESIFIALLFPLIPLVITQGGVNYIDLIISVFYLISLWLAAELYLQTRDGRSAAQALPYLYGLAVSTGLLLGMKYMNILLVLVLQVLAIPAMTRLPRRHVLRCALLALLFGGYWYLRNLFLLGNPIYPIDLLTHGFGIFTEGPQTEHIGFWAANLKKWHLLFFKDSGIGTFNGGFGLTFWGMAFPAWVMAFCSAVFSQGKNRFVRFFILAQFLFGLSLLLGVSLRQFPYTPRYAIFIAGPALIALGTILAAFQKSRPYAVLTKSLCIAFSFLSLTSLPCYYWPIYRIAQPISDFRRGEPPSEFKYYQDGTEYLKNMKTGAEPLDFITRPQGDPGLRIYLASDGNSFWIGSFYGSRLQNRIWNIQEDKDRGPADAFYFQAIEKDELRFYGGTVTPEDMVGDPQKMLIATSTYSMLFMDAAVLQHQERRQRLLTYYQHHYASTIQQAKEEVLPALESQIPILITHPYGAVLRSLQLNDELPNPLYWVPGNYEGRLLAQYRWPVVYTFQKPLQDYQQREILTLTLKDQTSLKIFKNTKMQ